MTARKAAGRRWKAWALEYGTASEIQALNKPPLPDLWNSRNFKLLKNERFVRVEIREIRPAARKAAK